MESSTKPESGRRRDETARGRHTVVLITSSYPRFPGDLTGTAVEPIAHGVAARGHAVHVVAPWHPLVRRPAREGGVHFHFYKYTPLRALHVFGYAGALRADVSMRPAVYAVAPAGAAGGPPAGAPGHPDLPRHPDPCALGHPRRRHRGRGGGAAAHRRQPARVRPVRGGTQAAGPHRGPRGVPARRPGDRLQHRPARPGGRSRGGGCPHGDAAARGRRGPLRARPGHPATRPRRPRPGRRRGDRLRGRPVRPEEGLRVPRRRPRATRPAPPRAATGAGRQRRPRWRAARAGGGRRGRRPGDLAGRDSPRPGGGLAGRGGRGGRPLRRG